jgi:hypothetical protein
MLMFRIANSYVLLIWTFIFDAEKAQISTCLYLDTTANMVML